MTWILKYKKKIYSIKISLLHYISYVLDYQASMPSKLPFLITLTDPIHYAVIPPGIPTPIQHM